MTPNKSNTYDVVCVECNWRSTRRPKPCECPPPGASVCRCQWGSCPKCGGRVTRPWLRASGVKLTRNRKSYDPQPRFWGRVRIAGKCWEWQGAHNGKGYGLISVNGVRTYAHRFAYESTWGDLDPGHVAMHICDNPRCVRPVHLRAGTQRENIEDATRKGRMGPRGAGRAVA